MKNFSGNLELMHEINTKQILRVIRQHSPISRSEIVEMTNLTAATVSRITGKLINCGLVKETGYGVSSGGRKPVLLELDLDSVLTVGIDIEIDEITGIVIDLAGKVLSKDRSSIKGKMEQDYILKQVRLIIGKLLENNDFKQKIIGIGIGMHGLVDYTHGISIYPPAFGWENVQVVDLVQKEFDLPVILENNVRALTFAEYWFGAAKKFNNFICLKVGAGIGSAVFIDGHLYRGGSNAAGEIGHNMVDENGLICTCGKYGCLESMASIPALVKRTLKALEQGAVSDILQEKLPALNEKHIFLAAEQGDPLAREILEETGSYLGIGVASIVNILNPEAVIICGEIITAGEIVLRSLRSTVSNRALAYPVKHLEIIKSDLGKDGVAIGAAVLIMESIFSIDREITIDIGI